MGKKSGLTKFVFGISFLGAIAGFGDYYNFNDKVTYKIWRNPMRSIEEKVTQLESKTLRFPIETSNYKDRILAAGFGLEGELSRKNYTKVQNIVEEKVTKNPLQYEDFSKSVTNALIVKGTKETRKEIYSKYPRDEKIQLSVKTAMEEATYMERCKIFMSWPEKEKNLILESEAKNKAKEIIEIARKNARKVADEIARKSIELGNWIKEKYQDIREE